MSNGGAPLLSCSTGPLSVVYDATTSNDVPALVGFIAGKPGVEWHHRTVIVGYIKSEKYCSYYRCLTVTLLH